MKKLQFDYDEEIDAAYITIDSNAQVEYTDSFSMDDIEFGLINIDFTKDNKIIGFEILSASKILSMKKSDNKTIN